jgi:prevent-host-death family protein
MRHSTQLCTISDLKTHASRLIAEVAKTGEPLVVTQKGKAKVVLIDIATHERGEQTLALLKILALGQQQVIGGKTRPARDVVNEIRHRKSDK